MEQIVLISSFLVPLVLSIVIFYNSRGNPPKAILAFSLLNAAAVFIANYFYFLENFHVYSYLHSIHVALVLFIYPSIFLYVNVLTGKIKFSLSLRILAHFLPGLLFFILYLIFFDLKYDFSVRITYLGTYRDEVFTSLHNFAVIEWIRLINVAVIILQVIGYSTAIFLTSNQYHIKLRNEFSNSEEFQIKWLAWFNVSLIVVAILSVVFYVVNPFNDENNQLLSFSMFSMSVFIWLIGIWGNAQPNITFPVDKQNTGNGTIELENIYEILVSNILKKKLYLNPDLCLSDLAMHAGTNRSYASQAVNNVGKMNFNTFVNKFRVTEAKEIIANNNKIKIEDVAMQSGFGSFLSMQRAFLKETGMTPNKWRKAIIKKAT